MLAKEIMSKNPEILAPSATLKEVAAQMSSHNFGFIPIGENDRLIGTITDRDIVVRAVTQGKDPNKTTVRDIMSKGIQYCFETDDIEKVVKQMKDLQIRRLIVLNKDKRITGIISLGDIATKLNDERLCGELTSAVSEH